MFTAPALALDTQISNIPFSRRAGNGHQNLNPCSIGKRSTLGTPRLELRTKEGVSPPAVRLIVRVQETPCL
ncbi:hypothetical protein BaRGS_00038175 [Batillaria attramentaria]|uniref:Uncharacterized protein n=1 Tax=Batillaria attramentaria TaxID=370345 RepID=A0ABD0J826_9CAEN